MAARAIHPIHAKNACAVVQTHNQRYESHTHTLALIPKGIKAGDLRRECEGLEIRNFLGNYCVALNR
jgi:hypothetical protein